LCAEAGPDVDRHLAAEEAAGITAPPGSLPPLKVGGSSRNSGLPRLELPRACPYFPRRAALEPAGCGWKSGQVMRMILRIRLLQVNFFKRLAPVNLRMIVRIT